MPQLRDNRMRVGSKRAVLCQRDCGFHQTGKGCHSCAWSQDQKEPKPEAARWRAEMIMAMKSHEIIQDSRRDEA